jgi:undecaprenyl-diphosphatase
VLHRLDNRGASPLTRARSLGAGIVLVCCFLAVTTPAGAAVSRAASGTADQAGQELTAAKAAVLGLVEGITEYLPISSTGHLYVMERILDVGTTKETKDAADTYAITIQGGAILAVLLLYRHRLSGMVRGALGRDDDGRRVFLAVVVAFIPAALVAVIFEQTIKDKLFGAGPIVIAWIVGGIGILVLAPRLRALGERGAPLDSITVRQAAVIGLAQVVALWPGTSRSLVTILAALFVGLNIVAAVEFSFLLGFVTLAAATGYEALKNGGNLVDTYGILNPLIGFVVAFVSAALAIRWLVSYLQRHDLSIFGWYRIAVAAVTLVLLATNVI